MTEADIHPEIHRRLDTMETTLSTSIGKLTSAVEKLVVLETEHQATRETLARYGAKLEKHDERLDTVEKVMPLIERFIIRADRISLAVTIMIIIGIVGSYFKFA